MKKLTWRLVDTKNKKYNVWTNEIGYKECFPKGENPNITMPFGQNTTEKNKFEEK